MEKYDFGNKLYEYRTQKGLTQKELGKLLGVTDKAVSKWETGESKPRLDKMTQITELFDTSIDRMLGGEAQDGGEQLKPYKTIFDSTLKKYDKYYKTARIWTYIFAVVYFVFSLIQKVGRLLSGTIALNTVSSLIEITVLTAAVLIFTLKFKSKFGECENKDMNIFAVFLFLLYCVIGTFLVVSAVQTGKLTGEISVDDKADIIVFGIVAAILLIILIISVIKKKYTVFAVVVGGFSPAILDSSVNKALFGLVMIATACQFACYIEKRNWLILAQKADIEIKKTNENQKVANVFITIIAVITLLNIVFSSFSPYIIYKICLKKYGPMYRHNEVIDFDYSAEFTDSFTEIELGNAKLKIPQGFEKYGEFEGGMSFMNAQKDAIMVSYYSEEDDENPLFDESDSELAEYYARDKWFDFLYQKYYGVSMDTMYGIKYIDYFTDLDDIKFYESEKAILLICTSVIRKVTETGQPITVSKFDNGMYTGLISGRLMTIGDKSNVYWTADIWHSNDLDGPYYSITYMAKNTSDIKDSQMICQIVNSLEF